MYGDLAWTWPIISPVEEYEVEADDFRRALVEMSRIPVQALLDLGCGGGHNDFYLKRSFQVTGVDLSAPMLILARSLNPEIHYMQGDMRMLRLEQSFDAVIIADSVAYMLTEDDLRRAFETAFFHLKPGGVFCTYVEHQPQEFTEGKTEHFSESARDVQITVIEHQWDPDQADTIFDDLFIYLIHHAGRLTIEADHHRLGIFPLQTWERLLKETGFEVMQIENSYSDPMFLGLRPDKH